MSLVDWFVDSLTGGWIFEMMGLWCGKSAIHNRISFIGGKNGGAGIAFMNFGWKIRVRTWMGRCGGRREEFALLNCWPYRGYHWLFGYKKPVRPL